MSTEKRYQGMRYEVPCSVDSEDVLVFRAFEDASGDVVLGVEVGRNFEGGYEADMAVVIGTEHLNEFHTAVNGALAAVADNGIRLIDEEYEATFKRLHLNDAVEASKPEPAGDRPAFDSADMFAKLVNPFGNLFADAASRAARDE